MVHDQKHIPIDVRLEYKRDFSSCTLIVSSSDVRMTSLRILVVAFFSCLHVVVAVVMNPNADVMCVFFSTTQILPPSSIQHNSLCTPRSLPEHA